MASTMDVLMSGTMKPATGYVSTSLHGAVKLRLDKTALDMDKDAADGDAGVGVRSETVPEFCRRMFVKNADLPAFKYRALESSPSSSSSSSTWITVTYATYAQWAEQTALMLLHVGLQPRSSVGILASNCPEWFYVEVGTLRAGGVVAGIYPSNSSEAVHHVLETSEATVCVVDNDVQMAKVRTIKGRLPRLRAVIQMHGPYADFVGVDEGYYRWTDLATAQYDDDLKEELMRRERDVMANECAYLIYTSGTVGMPKAVMITHDAILFNAKSVAAVMPHRDTGPEVSVSYLPLSHVAAQIVDFFLSSLLGACVHFADANALKGSVVDMLLLVRPTRFFGVPRIFEKLQDQFNNDSLHGNALVNYVREKSRQTVERHHLQLIQGKPSSSSLCYWFASKVTQQIKESLGLDRCKVMLVGGAPTSMKSKSFFMGIDLPLAEVYGLSETSGTIAIDVEPTVLGSTGKPLPGIEVMIDKPDQEGRGEICARGRTIFMGYLNDARSTADTMTDDGWLHTGDSGYLDTGGNLYIAGRIKEIVITSGGENIPPVRIEDAVKGALNVISNAMLVGDARKYLTMLLTIKTNIDPDTGLPQDALSSEAIDWLQTIGLQMTRLSEVLSIPENMSDVDACNVTVKPHPRVAAAIQEGIDRANEQAISNAQRVQKFALLPHDFTVATGELGPTLKIRRNIVLQKYGYIIESMYK